MIAAIAPTRATTIPPLITSFLPAAPVELCTKADPDAVPLLDEAVVLVAIVVFALATCTSAEVVLPRLLTMLLQLAWSLATLAHPLHTVATGASLGCDVATAGIPVMTPLLSVMDV